MDQTTHGFAAAHAEADHADADGLDGLGRQAQHIRLSGRAGGNGRLDDVFRSLLFAAADGQQGQGGADEYESSFHVGKGLSEQR